MSDERPKLRLVTDADEDLWDDDGGDPLFDGPAPRAKMPRLQRAGKYFVRIPLNWLAPPERGGGYPAWVRLHQYLWFRSREGLRAVRLTGNLATEVGLDRRSKLRALRQLEARGLVSVTRAGNKIPIVTVHPISGSSGAQAGRDNA
jgi:hypothetical protein